MSSVAQAPDSFVKELEDQRAMEGKDKVVFMCKFCKPNAKVRWHKNKLEIFHSHHYHFVQNGDELMLQINKVMLEDGGKYTCQCNDVKTSAWLYVDGEWARGE